MIYITDQIQLDQFLPVLQDARTVALDTEADSLHHYFEKLCLLQITVSGKDYIVDTLANLDLSKLMKILSRKKLICHGADFDLRMLYRFYSIEVSELFDTMIAAQFLGYERPSLATLVKKHFNVVLAKTNQKADWSKRPLTESMLEYARNDTHFLHELERILGTELKSKKRYEWFQETCQQLLSSVVKRNENISQGSSWRVKGWKYLDIREQIFLKEIWDWREREAKRSDRPRFKILGADQMIKIVQWVVKNRKEDFKLCPFIPPSFQIKKVESLGKALSKAWEKPADSIEQPQPKKTAKRFTAKQKNHLQQMKDERKKIADSLKMDPSLIASNSAFEALLSDQPKTPKDILKSSSLMKWQLNLLIDPLSKILFSS